MKASRKLLEHRAEDIAETAADFGGDDAYVRPLRAMVLDLANNLDSGERLDVQGLSALGAPPARIARMLRAIETEAIGVLASGLEQASFTRGVLALRKRIAATVPPSRLSEERQDFYRRFMTGDIDGIPSEHAHFVSLYEGVVGTVRELVYIHDLRGNLLYVNDYGLKLTKYNKDDFHAGLSIYSFLVPEYLDLVEERLASKEPQRFVPFTIEIYAKDGERIPVEVTTRPLKEKRRYSATVGIARDLRRERWMERELHRLYETFETLFANSPIGIIVASNDGVIQRANAQAAELCGAGGENDLTGMKLLKVNGSKGLFTELPEGTATWQRWAGVTGFGKKIDCNVWFVETSDSQMSQFVLFLPAAQA